MAFAAALIPFAISAVSSGVSAFEGMAQQKAAKSAAASQANAAAIQQREQFAAEEDAALQAAQNGNAAARLARAAGSRVLAFQGVDTGVSSSNPKLSTTLGGGA